MSSSNIRLRRCRCGALQVHFGHVQVKLDRNSADQLRRLLEIELSRDAESVFSPRAQIFGVN